jgi:hypothetical protein
MAVSIALLVALSALWTLAVFTHDPQIIASATTLLWLKVLLAALAKSPEFAGFTIWLDRLVSDLALARAAPR